MQRILEPSWEGSLGEKAHQRSELWRATRPVGRAMLPSFSLDGCLPASSTQAPNLVNVQVLMVRRLAICRFPTLAKWHQSTFMVAYLISSNKIPLSHFISSNGVKTEWSQELPLLLLLCWGGKEFKGEQNVALWSSLTVECCALPSRADPSLA